MLRYRDISIHTTDSLDFTSLTAGEFPALVPSFEVAFWGSMAVWILHGQRRQARRYTTSKHCPLPTPQDRLLFMLGSLKQHPTQLLHGRLFGMRQSKATPWMHVFLLVLRNAWRTLGDTPCRSVDALRQRLGREMPALPLASAPSEAVHAAPSEAAPFFVMTAPSDPFRAPKTRLHRKRALAARKSGTCSKTSG